MESFQFRIFYNQNTKNFDFFCAKIILFFKSRHVFFCLSASINHLPPTTFANMLNHTAHTGRVMIIYILWLPSTWRHFNSIPPSTAPSRNQKKDFHQKLYSALVFRICLAFDAEHFGQFAHTKRGGDRSFFSRAVALRASWTARCVDRVKLFWRSKGVQSARAFPFKSNEPNKNLIWQVCARGGKRGQAENAPHV